jgi:hypothetical protein
VENFTSFEASELSGLNNPNVIIEILQGLGSNYNNSISSDQQSELLEVWKMTVGNSSNSYEINEEHLQHFYSLKARFMGTVSDTQISDLLEQAGTTPEQAAQINYVATSNDLNAAGEQSFFTKYKTLIILATIGVLAAAGIYFYKKR